MVAGLPALAEAKHHRPGTLDPSFGPKGASIHVGAISASSLPDGLDNFGGLALDGGGRVLLGGDTDTPSGHDFVLGRFSKNGRTDQSFGSPPGHLSVGDVDGLSNDEVEDIAAGPNGATYIATSTTSAAIDRFGVSRLNAIGFFDGGFSVDGRTTTAIGAGANAGAITVQRNGRPVVAGQAKIAGKENLALVRYLPGGTPDPSFGGGDGVATKAIGQAFFASGVKVEKDGKIVVSGAFQAGGGVIKAVVVRYRANGTLDQGFAKGGVAGVRIGKSAVALGIGLGPRGTIILAGSTAGKGFVLRLTPAGRRDRSFAGGDGLLRSGFRQGSANLTDVAVQRNGKIVVAGFGGDIPGVPGGMLVARVTQGGRLDRGFGSRGARLFLLGATSFSLIEVAIQKSGRIVVGGSFSVFGTDGWLAARLYG